jgi:hypothetical protein
MLLGILFGGGTGSPLLATKIRLRVTSLGMTVVLFLTDAELRAGEGCSLTGVLFSKLSAIVLMTLGDASTPAPLWFSGPWEPLHGAADFLAGSGVSTTSGWHPGMGLALPPTGTGIPGSRHSINSYATRTKITNIESSHMNNDA